MSRLSGAVFNVGGGRDGSVSLAELTRLCRERSNRSLEIGRDPDTQPFDIPYYVTDNARVTSATGWHPARGIEQVVDDVFSWLIEQRSVIEPLLSGRPAARPAHLLGSR